MKINQLILLLFLSLLYFSAHAQDVSFPVTGNFNVQNEAGDREKDFNKVQIGAETFSLWMNGQLMRSYKIVSAIKGGFAVEQLVNGNVYKETFNVTIDQLGENDCYFTVHYEEGSETIHLRRQN